MSAEQLIIFKIFEQAIADYKYLKANKIQKRRTHDDGFSMKELEKFFHGKQASKYLQLMGSNLTGADIWRMLEAEPSVCRINI